jgi:hypothetical protein
MSPVIRCALVACLVSLFGGLASSQTKPALTQAQIKREIIRESLASYPGNCPCPYNSDRRGRACGRRSAYSRPGGRSPVCYESDVTPKMMADYAARSGLKRGAVEQAAEDSRANAQR